jgi:hypothetical protein
VDLKLRVDKPNVGWASKWPGLVAPRKGKGAGDLSVAEYDFSAIPESELEPCAYYEYSRECAKMSLQVEKLRAHMREQIEKSGRAPGSKVGGKMEFIKFTQTYGQMHDTLCHYLSRALDGRWLDKCRSELDPLPYLLWAV